MVTFMYMCGDKKMDTLIKWLGFGMQSLTLLIIPYFKSWFKKFEDADKENKNSLNNLEKEFYQFKNEVSNEYLKRDEYLTVSGNLMKKIDEIAKAVYRIEGELKNKGR